MTALRLLSRRLSRLQSSFHSLNSLHRSTNISKTVSTTTAAWRSFSSAHASSSPSPHTPPHRPEQPLSLDLSAPGHSTTIDPFSLISTELHHITTSIRDTVSILHHPVLHTAASHLLNIHGKRLRPVIVLLMAHATALSLTTSPATSLLPSQLRLAEITELIHAASLLHDDVIDVADTRRGAGTVNSLFGNQLAVLAGDFLLARASIALASLRDCDVVHLLSTVIEHLVRGELIQMTPSTFSAPGSGPNAAGLNADISPDIPDLSPYQNPTSPFQAYLAKTFFKTASLLAHSCRAVTVLAANSTAVSDAAFRYGEHLGIAFQLVDDLLDITSSHSTLGKPVLNDLKQGHATAPVLFAMEEFPEVEGMIERKFSGEGDIERALTCIEEARGVEKTRELATQHAQQAVDALTAVVPASDYRSALLNMANFVLTRQR